jgi:ribosomal protein S18 acetylase RimI-like enzyme
MNTLPTLTFRRAGFSDADALQTLWPHLTPTEAHTRLRQRSVRIILGFCGPMLVCGGELTRCGRFVEIANVVVLPQWRRRGAGAALVAYLCAAAQQLRVRSVQLTVEESNTAACALYARCGFEICGALAVTPSTRLLVMEKSL